MTDRERPVPGLETGDPTTRPPMGWAPRPDVEEGVEDTMSLLGLARRGSPEVPGDDRGQRAGRDGQARRGHALASTRVLRHSAAVLAEHEALRRTVARMRGLCRAIMLGQGPPVGDTRCLIAGFLADLLTHFAAEESRNGYFDTLVAERPNLEGQLALLHTEHIQLAETMNGVRSLARDEGQGPHLALTLGRVLDRVQAHDREENRVLSELLQHQRGRP